MRYLVSFLIKLDKSRVQFKLQDYYPFFNFSFVRFTKNANFKIALKTNQALKSSGKSQVKWLVEKVLFCFLKTSNLNYIFFLQILTLALISRSFFTSVVVTIKNEAKSSCMFVWNGWKI